MPKASNAAKTEAKTVAGQSASKSDAAALLKADHRKVEELFSQFETAEEEQKQEIVHQVCTELIIHTKLEEELFYPACREKNVEDDCLDEAQVEHDGAKVLIADLLQASPGDAYYDAKVKTLSEYIEHHVNEEEKPRSGILAKARKAGVDMVGLGAEIQARKEELMIESEILISQPPQPRSFTLRPKSKSQESNMARYYNERDERGRFTDDDNRGYQSRSQGNYRERDDQGRFVSDDDDDRGYSRSSRGRGHGGWFGDPEGHSEASREGWEDRGRRSSRSRYDDDERGYRSRGNYRDRDEQGRFVSDDDDDRGYSRSSRGRGHGGWYGDPEGHSEASREGWEERGHYGRRSSRSRYRDDDDDDRGRGQGGWFGDPRGHSQAAREGWRNR